MVVKALTSQCILILLASTLVHTETGYRLLPCGRCFKDIGVGQLPYVAHGKFSRATASVPRTIGRDIYHYRKLSHLLPDRAFMLHGAGQAVATSIERHDFG